MVEKRGCNADAWWWWWELGMYNTFKLHECMACNVTHHHIRLSCNMWNIKVRPIVVVCIVYNGSIRRQSVEVCSFGSFMLLFLFVCSGNQQEKRKQPVALVCLSQKRSRCSNYVMSAPSNLILCSYFCNQCLMKVNQYYKNVTALWINLYWYRYLFLPCVSKLTRHSFRMWD